MSTKLASRPGGGSKDGGDICPVCKSSRYLNPNMKFLVNPECYHKMCESCVDRIFSHGPAACPIAGCKRTLRKAKFRKQTFDDLKVEREVDIRRRVQRILNKKQSDFETLRDYNDYLETVEETTWNLILEIDVEATEKRLQMWDDAQKAQRNPNAIKRSFQPDPSLASETSHVILKKGGAQRRAMANLTGNTPDPNSGLDNDAVGNGFLFKGLKKYVAPAPEKPFDAFGGWNITPHLYILQEDYDVPLMTTFKNEPDRRAGGYEPREAFSRALCDAFAGFSVFLDEEIPNREKPSGDSAIGPQVAAEVGGADVKMDDIF